MPDTDPAVLTRACVVEILCEIDRWIDGKALPRALQSRRPAVEPLGARNASKDEVDVRGGVHTDHEFVLKDDELERRAWERRDGRIVGFDPASFVAAGKAQVICDLRV